MVTSVPAAPLAGEKPAIEGRFPPPLPPVTVKMLELIASPAGFVTIIGPVIAFDWTAAVICVSELTLKSVLTLPNRTLVAPVKFVPVIVTAVFTGPLVGEKLVIEGGKTTVKLFELVEVPKEGVTLISPVVVP